MRCAAWLACTIASWLGTEPTSETAPFVVVTNTLLFGAALAISDFTLSEICVSVGAASLPAAVEGVVAEIEGCAGAAVDAAAVSADETLGVKSVPLPLALPLAVVPTLAVLLAVSGLL